VGPGEGGGEKGMKPLGSIIERHGWRGGGNTILLFLSLAFLSRKGRGKKRKGLTHTPTRRGGGERGEKGGKKNDGTHTASYMPLNAQMGSDSQKKKKDGGGEKKGGGSLIYLLLLLF